MDTSGTFVTSSPRRKRRSQDERTADTRRRLFDATVSLVSEIGYAQTSTSKIVTRAGVSRGALQHHFAEKNDLMCAAVEDVLERYAAGVSRHSDPGKSIRERVQEAVHASWEWSSSNEYVAVIEILSSNRSDPVMTQRLQHSFNICSRIFDNMWISMFTDFRVSEDKLSLLRGMVASTLFGYSFRQKLFSRVNIGKTEIDALCEAVTILIVSWSAKGDLNSSSTT